MSSVKRRKKEKKTVNKNGIYIVAFIVVFFCIATGIYTINLKKESLRLEEKKANLEEQLEEEEQRKKDLEELEKYTQTKKYVEEVARQRLGLVYPDEILLQPSNK